MELLQKLNRNGMTVLMMTHDTAAAEYETRMIHVEDGKIVEKGDVPLSGRADSCPIMYTHSGIP